MSLKCVKCQYDMSGHVSQDPGAKVFRCSECGTEQDRESLTVGKPLARVSVRRMAALVAGIPIAVPPLVLLFPMLADELGGRAGEVSGWVSVGLIVIAPFFFLGALVWFGVTVAIFAFQAKKARGVIRAALVGTGVAVGATVILSIAVSMMAQGSTC